MFLEHNVNLFCRYPKTNCSFILLDTYCHWLQDVHLKSMCVYSLLYRVENSFHSSPNKCSAPSFLIVSLITSYPKVLPQRLTLLPTAGTLPALLNSCYIRSFSFLRPVESWLNQTRERYCCCRRGGGNIFRYKFVQSLRNNDYHS